MDENELATAVFNEALKVHKALGPGLLENAYEACLFYELHQQGLKVEKQVPMPLVYEQAKMDIGYRIDLLVERKFIVEVKAVEALNDVHMAQVLTYLRLSGCKLGFLMNFNVIKLKDGVKRVINGYL